MSVSLKQMQQMLRNEVLHLIPLQACGMHPGQLVAMQKMQQPCLECWHLTNHRTAFIWRYDDNMYIAHVYRCMRCSHWSLSR